MVSVLLVFLVLAIIQVGIVMHLRNVALAGVVDGARYAANADRTCADGVAKAEEILTDSIARIEVDDTRCETAYVDGTEVVVVTSTVRLPLLVLPIAPADVTITVTGRAVKEGR